MRACCVAPHVCLSTTKGAHKRVRQRLPPGCCRIGRRSPVAEGGLSCLGGAQKACRGSPGHSLRVCRGVPLFTHMPESKVVFALALCIGFSKILNARRESTTSLVLQVSSGRGGCQILGKNKAGLMPKRSEMARIGRVL